MIIDLATLLHQQHDPHNVILVLATNYNLFNQEDLQYILKYDDSSVLYDPEIEVDQGKIQQGLALLKARAKIIEQDNEPIIHIDLSYQEPPNVSTTTHPMLGSKLDVTPKIIRL